MIHYLILLVEEIQQNLSVTPSDSGMYYCIVMNHWGNMVQSDNATVNVLCELVYLHILQSVCTVML